MGGSFSRTAEKPVDSGHFERTISRLKADCLLEDGQMGNTGAEAKLEPGQLSPARRVARIPFRNYGIPLLFLGAVVCTIFGHPLTSLYLAGVSNCQIDDFPACMTWIFFALILEGALVLYSEVMPRLRPGWRTVGISLATLLLISWIVLYFFSVKEDLFGAGFARWARTHVDAQELLKWGASVRPNEGTVINDKHPTTDEDYNYNFPLPVGAILIEKDFWPPEAKAVKPYRVALLADGQGVVLQWFGGRFGSPPRMVYIGANESSIGPQKVKWPEDSLSGAYEWRQIGPKEWSGYFFPD